MNLTESTMKALQGKLIEDRFEDDEMDLESALEEIYTEYCKMGMQYEFWGDIVNTTGIEADKIRKWYNESMEELSESKKVEIKQLKETNTDNSTNEKLKNIADELWKFDAGEYYIDCYKDFGPFKNAKEFAHFMFRTEIQNCGYDDTQDEYDLTDEETKLVYELIYNKIKDNKI